MGWKTDLLVASNLVVGLALLCIACAADTSSEAACRQGGDGCDCYPNHTCNAALICSSTTNVCTEAPPDPCGNPALALCEGSDYQCRVCCPTGSWAIGGQCVASRAQCDFAAGIAGPGFTCAAQSCSFANSCYR
jgi:hypothetical protein